MFEKKLSPLESRKQLLIAESDLNRVLLVKECHALAGSFYKVIEPVKYLGLLASPAAVVMGLFKAFRNRNSEAGSSKSSWFSLLRLGLAFWLGLRGRKERMSSND
jgi:hypothetical protein